MIHIYGTWLASTDRGRILIKWDESRRDIEKVGCATDSRGWEAAKALRGYVTETNANAGELR